jgi:hypothetical protein
VLDRKLARRKFRRLDDATLTELLQAENA